METATRRSKSDAEKRAKGEERVTAWISAEASAALAQLRAGGASKTDVISAALVAFAAPVAPKSKR